MHYPDVNEILSYCNIKPDDILCNIMKKKDLMLVVDDTKSSQRAVIYVGSFLSELKNVQIHLAYFTSIPENDFFNNSEEMTNWIEEKEKQSKIYLDIYKKVLIQFGFSEDQINLRSIIKYCPSLSDCIIEEQHNLETYTVVIGREKMSKEEEFLFGSTTLALLEKRNCALWIIE